MLKGILKAGLMWSIVLAVVFVLLQWRLGYGETGNLAVWNQARTGDEMVQTADEGFIVIDSGHGFFDAGKLGVNGAEEKTINLAIALKLRTYLEQQGYAVRMTRENDETLYDGSSPDTKKEDMEKRAGLMNDSQCILSVSIHQNSFTQSQYRGAQVFYYTGSDAGQRLASSIQNAMIELVDESNTRREKANSDYYLLKKSETPTVICECGFLSNSQEAELLVTDEYQEKLAWAISVGITRYLNSEE